MKTLLISLGMLVLMAGSAGKLSAQKPRTGKSIDTVAIVKDIKLQFAAIDAKRKSYTQYEPTSDKPKGELLTGYFADTTLKMINAAYYGDTGRNEMDCYVNQTGVIFVFGKEFAYAAPLTVDRSGTSKSITENFYYFNQGELIKWVSAGKVKPAGSEGFKNKNAAWAEELKKYKKHFSSLKALRRIK